MTPPEQTPVPFGIKLTELAAADPDGVALVVVKRDGPEDVVNFDEFVGPGYGRPSEAGNEAVKLFAQTEGVILDPVYTGKAAAGLIDHVRTGRLGKDDVVVFVHTGGSPAIFTHSDNWLS